MTEKGTTENRIPRRTVLGAAAGGVAASLLPPSLHTAMAAAPLRKGGLSSVEHVIVLMQENRSFDHYFGTCRACEGTATGFR